MKTSRLLLPVPHVASLTWCGDTLIDWVRGGLKIHLDGRVEDRRVGQAYSFNAARATKDGRFAIVYQRFGTKALLLEKRYILRELNRSYYHAESTEYPVCLWHAVDGRTLIAHCPEKYWRIDIDEVETGRRLTAGERKPFDYFQSGLSVNASGTYLMSAG